ncbi:CcdB family protein [Roseicyclus persicicus]|uniref:Toxin CcdB n=1 Tax=Roseicyclus persicicus TaxID=2650661 RepID=A0A7X6H0H7_9RHOB|nr:CcdB family protein [Roseibacterium persicicum]NKX45109.1 plasmid maintenance protein CcdB [Roseibacterium persicicum]
MAQYRVYRLQGGELVLDLQTDMIATSTRIVARLVPPEEVGPALKDATPILRVDGRPMLLLTTHMAAVPGAILQDEVQDLSGDSYTILRAVDMVFTGI